MAGEKREAALSLKLEDLDSVIAGVERLEARLRGVLSLADNVSRGGGGVTSAAAPLTGGEATMMMPAHYAPAGAGPGATFSAANSTIPLNQPVQGSPQQLSIGTQSVAAGTYNTPDLDRTQRFTKAQLQAAQTSPFTAALDDWTSWKSRQTGLWQDITQSLAGAGGVQGVTSALPGPLGMIAGRMIQGGMAALPMAVAGAGTMYAQSVYGDTRDVLTEAVSRASSGMYTGPETMRRMREQLAWRWMPDWMPILSDVKRLALESAKGTESFSRNVLDDMTSLQMNTGVPLNQEAAERPLAQIRADLPRFRTMGQARGMTMLGGIVPETGFYDIGNPIAGDMYEFSKRWNRGTDAALQRLASGLGRSDLWMVQQAIARGENPMRMDWLSTAMATIGDVGGTRNFAVIEGAERHIRSDYTLARQQERSLRMGEAWGGWAGYHTAEAHALTAAGAPGEWVFGEAQQAQSALGGRAQNLQAYRRRLEDQYRRETNPALKEFYWQKLGEARAQESSAMGEYAQAGRSAGFGLIGYQTGLYGAAGDIARTMGLSPASFMESQAGIYGNLLANPEAYLGKGVQLSPLERLQYTGQALSLRVGAAQAQYAYRGGLALAGEQEASAGISGMRAGGQMWSREMEAGFTAISGFTARRIEAIDEEIQRYAAAGLTESSLLMGQAKAQRAGLVAGLEQVKTQAFQTKYSLLGVPVAAAAMGAEAGIGRVTGLGRGAEELAMPFALQRASADVGLMAARNKYAEAVRVFPPNSIHVLQAAAELEQAETRSSLLPLQQIETEYGQRSRPWAATMSGLSQLREVRETMWGSNRARSTELSSIAMASELAGLAGRKYEAVRSTPGVGPAAIAEAWQEKTSAEVGLMGRYLELSTYTLPPEIEERLESARFGQQVLQSTMTARGSVRQMARERMGAAEEGLTDLALYREQIMKRIPVEARPFVEHELNRRMRGLQMERVSAEQQLQQGWLERLTANVWNAPGNFGLVANEFSYSGAVMRHGVRARHLGSTSADLDYYREQAGDYFTFGGAGKFGSPMQFAENALAGVTDIGGGLLPPIRRRSAGAPGLESAPPLQGASAAQQVIEVRVVVEDPQGNVLGSANRVVANDFGISLMINPGLNGNMSP